MLTLHRPHRSGEPRRHRRSYRAATAALAAATLTSSLLLATTPAAASSVPRAQSQPASGPTGGAGAGDAADTAAKQRWIDGTIARMTLEEKVGQLFSTHVYGRTVDSVQPENIKEFGLATPREIISKYHLGGVLYFAWTYSVDSPEQAAGLSNGIQNVAMNTGAKVPMLMSIDQEGGLVTRMLEPATQTPGGMALGATRDTAGARDLAAIQGKELAAVGIRQNFAPVADVNINPANPVIGVRSFGSNPQLVAEMTAAQVRGYQDDAGISSAAKHFPGHGDTDVDSHYGFPIITHTREQWEQIDRPPFQAAIDAGIQVIMTAHLQVPALDNSGDPATLSKPILTGILRGEMGYQGVIVTDSLGMQGVRDKYGDDRVPVLALKAGADILLNPPNLDVAYTGVLNAVKSGELTESRLDESLRRVLNLKWINGTVANPYVNPRTVKVKVGTQRHLDRVQQVTNESTTVLRNENKTLPMAVAGKKILVTGYNATARTTLAGKLTARGAGTSIAAVSTNPTAAEQAAAVSAAGQADAVVLLSYNSATNTGQKSLVAALQQTGKPLLVVSVGNPYDINQFPTVPAYAATYSTKPVALESLVRVLTGEISPKGKLPVDIPKAGSSEVLYPYGSGLSW
ncbi:glycoside hydrolase family 3 protein [Nakamurella aerolata]|uniref:beta-N-acetylhexosaminidase n=1 Tax=Nakamurella aerolata TaxID=1656892 RepID=A0A849A227_9ACTN|nr:glycoside hydrolase family 3 protein [Nakamurella aerolata]NNG34615.1 glycoside hydrolase family 3 protein [Nakamurella aerolata]